MSTGTEKPLYRYEEIASQISQAINEGTIGYGSRLPSLRTMSSRYSCALSVVMQAYELLERQGLAYAVEKSGFFARNPLSTPLPEPQKEKYYLNTEDAVPLSIIGRIVEAGNDCSVIPLGAGNPHESLLPVKHLKQSLQTVLKEEPRLLTEYCDEGGNRELRRALTSVMLERGTSLSYRDILITNGCSEALTLAIESCSSPGDIIVTESPVFLGIIQILDQLKRRVITIPTDTVGGMNLNHLESVLKKEDVKAVIMTAIHQNPLGFTMSEENRQRAVDLTARFGVPLIEDDVYSSCSFEGRQERPLKSFDTGDNVIYCSSLSKTLSPGVRIGWLAGGRKHELCRKLKMALSLGGNAMVQSAVAGYLASPRYSKNLQMLQKMISRQAAEMRQLLISALPEGTAITDPAGGFYFWVELPGKPDCLRLFEEALEEGISTVPGQAFSVGDRYRNCLRISYASPITDDTREAVIRLGELIEKMK
ncbi:MAG: PLP-dependent aminotransferase family protein [Spirochaetales bacterium]|nr:PLP-dependent aminotransferase family protein [Spirochaetales bacterium]